MSNLLSELVLEFLSRHSAVDAKLVVAVSGGVDSVALLNALHSISRPPLVCAHIDHGIRAESKDDCLFVGNFAKNLGIPFEATSLTPPSTGIEAWGREERYKFLQAVRERHQADWIVTAHTADDQIETVLMRVLQGREPIGISVVDKKRNLLRPLLGVHKCQLIDYCTNNGLTWREDSSNLDAAFLRNRIRNEYLPALLAAGGSRAELLLLVNTLSSEVMELRGQAEALSDRLLSTFGSKEWLRGLTEVLRAIPAEHQWRLAEAAFLQRLGYRLGLERSKLVVDFILQGRVGIQLPGGFELRRKGGGLVALYNEKV